MNSPIATSGGRLLTVAGQIGLLFKSATVPPPPPPSGPMPTTGLAGWWDASNLVGGQTYNTLSDSSPAGKSASTGGAKAYSRLAPPLGGLYVEGNYFAHPFALSYLHPFITNYAVAASGVTVGTGGTFTVFLVWSRANQVQVDGSSTSSLSTAAVPLVDLNGTTILNMTGKGDGTDTLTLFPSGTPVTGGVLGLRHTHSVRIVFNGSTVDVWLDGAVVISAATVPTGTLGSTANLSFLNGAQCIFHEAACWSHALTPAEQTSLSSYAQRWPLGPRRAINGVMLGQSNMNLLYGDGDHFITAKRIAYLTGCISSNVLISVGDGRGQLVQGSTTYSGQGTYAAASNAWFLDSTPGGDPSTWVLGANGNLCMTALDGMTADQRANLRFIAWYWSESDSGMVTPSTKATYTTAMKRAFSLIRAHLNMTPAQLPIMVINALPYDKYNAGCQTHREVMQDLVNDPNLNIHFMLNQADDAIGDGDSWDSVTGLESGGGNTAHRGSVGRAVFARRMGIPIARAALAANAAAGTPDVVTAFDGSIPQMGGPSIASAHYEGTTYAATGTVLVTVAHDGGNDLKLPLRAAQGVGWTLMDGVSDTVAGTTGTPGTLITATACARVSATQLRVTLASAPAHPTKAQMYYNYGSGLDANSYAIIGQGNAVTDNFAAVTLTPGWQIGADMGAAEQFDNALQSTTYGIALT